MRPPNVAQQTLAKWLAAEVVPPVDFYMAALEIVELAPRPSPCS
jgi:hypothetical protein